ncbi:(R)-mandelonitrile lyase [Flavobacterium foetidum]|uniref:(R)-mandelonitrile lyase n=1 Tax=Flavobacterium foetidum TaxID=2026681 RepID=UPI00107522E4|nr:cupin domain-containing protein [Flavobacterium foetidum]KAF2514846.1 cupin domain-containing protein [Flavobacterium foetidum]
MRTIIVSIIATSILIACKSKTETMNTSEIFPKGDPLSNDWFTGHAFLKPLIAKDNNNEYTVGSVTFEPGARTNWHTHPKGQVLLVIEGQGLYQEKDKTAQIIKKGDVINIPENTEHWHGATSTTKMVHIAITNFKEETQVTWLHPVTEEEYRSANTN